jgi:ABC-type lipoprotein release transport system permease subunit
MTKATIQGLLGRKLRTALTALAVVLGVAMVSGTYVLTDTISKAFNTIFEGSYENTSAVITGKEVVEGAASGKSTVPESLLPEVSELPSVASASGAIYDVSGTTDLADLIGRDGRPIGSSQQPHFGWGFDPRQPKFIPLTLTAGDWADGSGQVVIDAGTAKNEDYAVGDTIKVAAEGPIRSFRISGVAKVGDVDSIGGATFGVFDVPTAQRLLGKEGELDSIFLAAKPGAADAEVARQVRPLLPASASVQTGAEQGRADAEETNDGIKIIQYFLLAFAAISLIVGSFVIFNTLSMTVAQRVRELATLRTLESHEPGEWPVFFDARRKRWAARLCAVRKSTAAAERAKKKTRRINSKRGKRLQGKTLESAEYIFVLATPGLGALSAAQVLELYRTRWQIELAFKRMKSLMAVRTPREAIGRRGRDSRRFRSRRGGRGGGGGIRSWRTAE